jgi:arabinogalactan endo-1,4-beta-galactosidase
MLPRYEQDASGFRDVNNRKITDFITWTTSACGWNTFRVRIFVHPNQKEPDYTTTDYAVCQDLAYVTALGKRIKAAGAYFLLDFHYSDSWVDATHIQAPAAWKGSSDAVMADSVGRYTREVLDALNEAGATPDLVQVGNEIMYGLCGIQVNPNNSSGYNWTGYIGLLKAGCNAVREKCPNAQIIIHTDRPTNKNFNFNYYNKLIENGVDFDIIGLSYYPFWHAGVNNPANADVALQPLVSAINYMRTQPPLNTKRVHIVETAYNFQYWPSEGVNYDTQTAWPCSVQGQYNFVKDLVDKLKPLENVDGISYWFPEDLGNGDYVNWTTKARMVEEVWSNRGFWNENTSSTGHTINKTGTASASNPAENVCAPYYLKNFFNDTQDIDETRPDAFGKSHKIIRDGQIIIIKGDKYFNVLGQCLP